MSPERRATLALQVSALQGTTPTIVAFLTNLTVAFTPILGGLILRERLTRAAVIYTLEPVLAVFYSAVFISEPMTARKLVGGAVIVGANLACELLRRGAGRSRPEG